MPDDAKPVRTLADLSPQRGELIEVPLELLPAFQANPLRALRDLAAVPSFAIDPWDPDGQLRWEQVDGRPHPGGEEAVVVNGKRWYFSSAFKCAPEDTAERWIHCDLGLSRDSAGFAMVHVKPQWVEFPTQMGGTERRPHVTADLMIRIRPPQGGQIQFSEIRERIFELKEVRGFTIGGISFDGWQSVDSLQILSERGYRVEECSVDRTLEPYECLLEYMRMGAISFYEYAPFLEEWQALQLYDGKRCDHLPNGSKDVTDAVAGAVYMATTHVVAGGAEIGWL